MREEQREKNEVEEEKRRWKVDLGLNKSPVTKQITQLHSPFPGCVRVCSYTWHFADDHDHIRGIRQLQLNVYV